MDATAFIRCPLGYVCRAPKHFQKQVKKIFTGLEGILCHMDDAFIFGQSKEEHNV